MLSAATTKKAEKHVSNEKYALKRANHTAFGTIRCRQSFESKFPYVCAKQSRERRLSKRMTNDKTMIGTGLQHFQRLSCGAKESAQRRTNEIDGKPYD